MFDRVDKNDQVVGKTTKEEAHQKGYIHRVAVTFVFDDDKLLIQHRKKDGYLDHSVGGHVEAGESYDEAALRETKEELGLDVELVKVGGPIREDWVLPDMNIQHHIMLYEYHLKGEKVLPSADEVEDITRQTLKDIASDMTLNPHKYTGGFKHTLNFYSEKHGIDISVPL